ncbi:aldehyde dehydrogenase family protein [Mameliella alba]|nr:aldehyde dehydrogenase family protein [Mameliella alba]MBY6168810.1 aldehyde dehydrogenase family protein [Mameliella alba]MBY6173969.1 aldehyde dehydrogenase family protein [Mameliella alba]
MPSLQGRHFLAGDWIGDVGNGTIDVLNPANGEVIGTAPNGSAKLAGQAVHAARDAFEGSDWAVEPRLRAQALTEFADALQARQKELAKVLARESGKVLAQAMGEIAAGFGEARYYAGVARNIFGRTFESGKGKLSLITREPSGVVSVIVPWNAPVTLLVRSVAPALAAGCSVVIKPAPQTPLTNAIVMECFEAAASLPKGIVNSVNEFGTDVGHVLSTHREIDVISFTGSSRTGKIIMANAAETIKHVSLELGGKAPAIVFPDADLPRAVGEILRGALALNGQMCTCISRILVHDDIYDEARAALRQAFAGVVMGNPLHEGVGLGPLIDRPSQARILGLVERASDEAEVLLQGDTGGAALEAGNFVSPTLFEIDDVMHDLVQEELFGPIVSVERFSDEAEALAKANATRFGLAASVYTRDMDLGMRMSRKLKFGTVWNNCHNRLMAEVETGGYRESGIGRLHGIEAMNDFLESKHIYFEDAG